MDNKEKVFLRVDTVCLPLWCLMNYMSSLFFCLTLKMKLFCSFIMKNINYAMDLQVKIRDWNNRRSSETNES